MVEMEKSLTREKLKDVFKLIDEVFYINKIYIGWKNQYQFIIIINCDGRSKIQVIGMGQYNERILIGLKWLSNFFLLLIRYHMIIFWTAL